MCSLLLVVVLRSAKGDRAALLARFSFKSLSTHTCGFHQVVQEEYAMNYVGNLNSYLLRYEKSFKS
jgi:hypothetical protein